MPRKKAKKAGKRRNLPKAEKSESESLELLLSKLVVMRNTEEVATAKELSSNDEERETRTTAASKEGSVMEIENARTPVKA
ncbi:unnamed protein product [Angiostrongylus costaricensis]|uniref:BLVR domain-containing protein n=1 Tax=Angiostrongylus costaricensis TaxID=334426 RepID=A0A0R3PCH3_ANGCS|nr:unnamed protein product [Angiostrongylus costaricensis]